MKAAVRMTDSVTRLGGDEFICLVRGMDTEDDVVDVVRAMQKQVGRRLEFQQSSLEPQLSCGIAIFPKHGLDAETLLSVADRALYTAKRQGKSCAVCASSERMEPRLAADYM